MNGALGQFSKPEAAAHAVRRARGAGAWRVEAYTPFPHEELAEAVDESPDRLPAIVFGGAVLGGGGALLLQYWASVVDYPLNVGGRPFFSWPAFVPVCFELTVLLAALSAVFGMIALNGLPRLHHPLFEIPAFKRASRDKFFVLLFSYEELDRDKARQVLRDSGAEEVYDVP